MVTSWLPDIRPSAVLTGTDMDYFSMQHHGQCSSSVIHAVHHGHASSTVTTVALIAPALVLILVLVLVPLRALVLVVRFCAFWVLLFVVALALNQKTVPKKLAYYY